MNHFTIEYKKVSGKGWGLHFNNIPKALRDAMLATFKDPEVLAEAAKLQLEINKPISGEEMQAQVARVYKMPARIAERLRRISQSY